MKLDLKSFEVLEKKIQRTIDLVQELKGENRELKSKVEELQGAAKDGVSRTRQLESMKTTQEQLERELKQLQDERQTVLARVDGLLEHLDRIQVE